MELTIIQNKIYEIRGRKVMLDFDLAEMYEVPTKVLNQSVKRNNERFPLDFMFTLTNEEFSNLRSQIVTSSWGGIRYLPNAFTEHGVAMLASVLKSKKAIEVNLQIIRAFIVLRQYALGYAELNQKLEHFMRDTNTQFNDVYQVLTELVEQKKELDKPRKPVGFIVSK
ncbi:MAG: ORF6N domain-containing protein [Bacteroidetes bacterium]|nr:ORF6N domain-containing protein [Bacteroidota bacterium]